MQRGADMSGEREMEDKGPADRPRKARQGADKSAGKPLRQEVMEIDREILRLLLKRNNLLGKMRRKGRIDPAEEKSLREAWQAETARVSRDPELSGRFFALLQSMSFLPKPVAGEEEARKRQAFNLAPAKAPVSIGLAAPLDTDSCRAWLYLAAASGQAARLAPSPQNDPIVDFVKALDQLGGAVAREDDALACRPFQPLGRPDKIIHAGDSPFNFYLILAHYLGACSRVKITGETALKLSDFSAISHAAPGLGARISHMLPKSSGLPLKLECSGILPAGFTFAPELPGMLAVALLLAASFYETPFSLDLGQHPDREEILARSLPILSACGATFALNGGTVSLQPAALVIPPRPSLPLDPEIASILLAMPEALGGKTSLSGQWPDWPETRAFREILLACGLDWRFGAREAYCARSEPLPELDLTKAPSAIPQAFRPLLAALAACAALRGGKGRLGEDLAGAPETGDFLRAAGLEIAPDGALLPVQEKGPYPAWTAPTAPWALALALAACARPGASGFQLANPGAATELWPSFWVLYNSLPAPSFKKKEAEKGKAVKNRRRILTSAVAEPPEIREEDWDA